MGVGHCKADFHDAFGNFSAAYHVLVDTEINHGGVHGASIKFHHDRKHIKAALLDLSHGIRGIADGVVDCHLEELLQLLELLSLQLGLQPEILLMEYTLKILIDGREIELEVADICSDIATENWPSLGFDLMRLAKTLLT